MSAPKRVVLFDNTVSPQTGITSGNSAWFVAWDSDGPDDGPVDVRFFASGTFSGATIKIELSDGGSPAVAVPTQVANDADGTLSDLSFTAKGSIIVPMIQGQHFRAVLTEGSPLGSINLTARGQVQAV